MDNITALLLRLVRSVITNTPVGTLEDLDEASLRQLYALSRKHELAHLACEGLKRANAMPTGELGAEFKKQRMAAIYGDERKQQALEQVCDCLSREGIPYIPLKGSIMRDYYPEAWMRNRCDIDVLVHSENLERACQALEAVGYVREDTGPHDVSLHSPEKVHLELHFMLHHHGGNIDIPLLEQVWDYAKPVAPGSCHFVLTDAMYYFYHVGHIAKHIRRSGCGIRPFLDLWFLDGLADADKEGRENLLQQGGLLTFARTASKLAASWIMDAPCQDPLCRKLEDYIVSSGVYGSKSLLVANANENPGSFLRQVFLSYSTLASIYPILKKKPWLYPFYQVVRWWDGLRRTGVRKKFQHMQWQKDTYKEKHTGTRQLMEDLELWKFEE